MKELENLNQEQKFMLALTSSDIAVFDFYNTKQIYEKYKMGMLDEMSQDRKIEMDTLSLLEDLGYPMEELGTYLYKNIIVNIIKYLNNIKNREDIISCKNFILLLKDAFSQFYFDVARNDLDMGVKSFHKHIENALLKVDYSKTNPILLYKIYSNFNEEIDYGENAFILGAYLTGYSHPKKTEVPKIKKLSNMPDVQLKY